MAKRVTVKSCKAKDDVLAAAAEWTKVQVDDGDATICISPRLVAAMKQVAGIVKMGYGEWIKGVYLQHPFTMFAIEGPYQQLELFPNVLATALHILTFDKKTFYCDTEEMMPYYGS